jgi:hypothetical protein
METKKAPRRRTVQFDHSAKVIMTAMASIAALGTNGGWATAAIAAISITYIIVIAVKA